MSADEFTLEGPVTTNALQAATTALIAIEAWVDGAAPVYSAADGKLHPKIVQPAAGAIVSVTGIAPISVSPGVAPMVSLTGVIDTAHGGTGSATGSASGLNNIPAAQLAGSAPLAALATALALGGGPIAATVLTATTRTESPTIGTSSTTQHLLPTGTADLLTADSTATVTGKSIDAAQLTGSIENARLSAAVQFASTLTSDAQTQINALLPASSTKLLPAPSGAGKVPYDNGSAYAEAAAGSATQVFAGGAAPAFIALTLAMLPSAAATKYTTPGSSTWTKGAGTRLVLVACQAGGAGGASGRRGTAALSSGGSGGGGGGFSFWLFLASDLAASLTVTVGGGGAGGAAVSANSTNGNAGAVGGVSSFGTLLRSDAGAASSAGTVSGGAGTAGGSGTFAGFTSGSGNAAGDGSAAPTSVGLAAGGGGGGGGPTGSAQTVGGAGSISPALSSTGAAANAAGASNTSLPTGGGGGGGGASGDAGGTVAGTVGGAGGTPGGGGGGGGGSINGANSGAGGAGANGCVWVIEF